MGFRYEEVADRAGVNKASVYRNWPQRSELAIEALSHRADQQVPFADTGDLRADLIQFLVTLAAELDTPLGRALAVAAQSREHEAVTRTVHGVYERRLDLVRVRLERAAERGELPPVDPLFFAQLISGPMHPFPGRTDVPFGHAEAERLTDVVLAGIRATGADRLREVR